MASYAATSDVTDYVDFGSDANADSDLIDALIVRASKRIDDYCGRTFIVFDSDYSTRLFDGLRDVWGPELFFDKDISIMSTVTNGDGSVVTTDQYVTLPANETPWYGIRLKASSGVAWTFNSDPEEAISVIGHWSYNSTSDNLTAMTDACVRMVTWMYKQRESQADLDRPLMVEGSGNILMPTRLPDDVRAILNPYRRAKVWAA
jgi:hypothetical protein